MSTVDVTNLTDKALDELQKLIRANIDARDGFRECAEEISEPQLATLFRQIANEREAIAAELQNYVEWNGKEAEDDGSVAGTVHRSWINIRAKINGGDPHVILIEAERGEDAIKESYEDVLKETAGSPLNGVLQSQYLQVKAGHDKIRDLRDHYAKK